MKFHDCLNLLTAAFKAKKDPSGKHYSIMILGGPGAGKSDCVAQACAAANMKLIVTHPQIAEPTDYKGLPVDRGEAAEFIPFGQLNQWLNAKEWTVVFGDDIAHGSKAVQSAWMQLVLAREIDGKAISDKVLFVMAGNRRTDRAGAEGIISTLTSRVSLNIENFEPDLDSWLAWSAAHDGSPSIHSFLSAHPTWFAVGESAEEKKGAEKSSGYNIEGKGFPCARTWTKLSGILGIAQFLDPVKRLELYAGNVGKAAATGFIAHEVVVSELTPFEAILADPMKAKVPEDAAARYAMACSVGAKTDIKNVPITWKYLNRFSIPFQTRYWSETKGRHPEVMATKEFRDWASRAGAIIF